MSPPASSGRNRSANVNLLRALLRRWRGADGAARRPYLSDPVAIQV
jgi:hypothetical protein